jgi:hypothetical protein
MFEDPTTRTEAVSVPLFYGLVEAVLIGIYCLLAWKVGWTKAPAEEKLCVVMTKTYEIEDDNKDEVVVAEHSNWFARLFIPRVAESQEEAEVPMCYSGTSTKGTRSRFDSADVTVSTERSRVDSADLLSTTANSVDSPDSKSSQQRSFEYSMDVEAPIAFKRENSMVDILEPLSEETMFPEFEEPPLSPTRSESQRSPRSSTQKSYSSIDMAGMISEC